MLKMKQFVNVQPLGMKRLLCIFLLFIHQIAFAQSPPQPYGAVPTAKQLAWHALEMYGLIHFTPTTFENKEWGYGDADPKIFNPSRFNARQIVKAARNGGLKGIILVAKHHDGFALWPTQTTTYSITKSQFKGGKGDIVKEMATAAREYGLKFGVYCSPWDRNNAAYGTPAYLAIYQAQLKELYSNYGELFMSWHDGANGGDGFYGGAREKRAIDNATYYDWKNTWQITQTMQPMANIFSDVGPDVRWVGNEDGHAADTSWATFTPMPPVGKNVAVPGQSNYPESPAGIRNGKYWMPAECDVPLRQGWFFHPTEKPKSAAQLFERYLKSVGRGAALDLGLAPDLSGRLHDDDVTTLAEFGKILKKTFAENFAKKANIKATNIRGKNFNIANLTDGRTLTYWASDDSTKSASITLSFNHEINFDLLSLQEYIALGQRIDSFSVEVLTAKGWQKVADGASIGAKRLIKFDQLITTKKIRLSFSAPVCLTLSEIGLFKQAN
jgi:alpha-L-fucosidase